MKQEFDVVHYNSPPVDIAISLPLIARLKKMKQTFIIHGGLFRESKNYFGRQLIKSEDALYDKVFILSSFAHKIALQYGFDPEKFKFVKNGVDLDSIEGAEPLDLDGNPKIVYVGRLARLKGVDLLLKAFSVIGEEYPEAVLYIVGDGPYRNHLTTLSRNLRVEDRVQFEGFISQTSAYRYYKSADLFVLPSYEENFSIATAEAMATPLPVIVSDAEGLSGLVSDGFTGLIFPRGDWRKLSQKMLMLLSDVDLTGRLKENALKFARENFNWARIASEYEETFRNLVEK